MTNLKNKKPIWLILLLVIGIVAASFAFTGCSSTSTKTNTNNDAKPAEGKLTAQEIDGYIAKMKQKLTKERTGKELDPAAVADIKKFAEQDDGKPFYMVNLIKENEKPMYPENWKGEKGKTVLEAKKLYSAACLPFLAKNGSSSAFGVTLASPPAYNETKNPHDWDQFYLVKYQSRRIFMELITSDAYADAVVHKNAGDKNTLLIPVTVSNVVDYKTLDAFNKTMSPLTKADVNGYMSKIQANLKSTPETLARFRAFGESDDGKPFFMVNLVKQRDKVAYPEAWTGEKGASVLEAKGLYTKTVNPVSAKLGITMIVNVASASSPALNDTGYDIDTNQFYVVGYPSRKAFFEMLSSPEYAKSYIHKYAGDETTILIPTSLPVQ